MVADLYLRLRERVSARPGEQLHVGQLSEVLAERPYEGVVDLPVTRLGEESVQIVSGLEVLRAIHREFPDLSLHPVGRVQDILVHTQAPAKGSFLIRVLTSLLLFFGSALAILYFHADVSMHTVLPELFRIVSGSPPGNPSFLYVPYSLGIGLGMALFFYQPGRKWRGEPSPLEVEVYLYQQNVDRYRVHKKEEEEKERS